MNFKPAVIHIFSSENNSGRREVIQLGLFALDNTNYIKVFNINPSGKLSIIDRNRTGLSDRYFSTAINSGNQDISRELSSYTHLFFLNEEGHESSGLINKLIGNNRQIIVTDISLYIPFFLPKLRTTRFNSLYRSLFNKELDKEKSRINALTNLTTRILEKSLEVIFSNENNLYKNIPSLFNLLGNNDSFKRLIILAQNLQKISWLDGNILFSRQINLNNTIEDYSGDYILSGFMPRKKVSKSLSINISGTTVDDGINPLASESAKSLLNSKYLNKFIPGYSYRDQQGEYSEHIITSLNEKGHIYLEAPTGIGKTLGYLLPAAAFIEKNKGRKVVIATSTKNLQAQVYEKEWPVLKERFSTVNASILKGKSNFICVTALSRFFDDWVLKGNDEQIKSWIYLAIILHNLNGDIEYIPSIAMTRELRELCNEVNARKTCYKGVCIPSICTYGRHLRIAIGSDIIITNHHKLPLLETQIKDVVHAVIIDEADRFGDGVRSALTEELNSRDVNQFIYRLSGSGNRKGYLQILLNYFNENKHDKQSKQIIKALEFLQTFKESFRILESLFREAVLSKRSRNKEFQIEFLNIKNLDEVFNTVIYPVENLKNIFNQLLDDESILNIEQIRRINGYSIHGGELIQQLKNYIGNNTTATHARTVEIKDRSWSLKQIPIYIQDILKKSIFENIEHITFTSATLFIGDDKWFFPREYEKEPDKVITYSMEPCFNYHSNIYFCIDTTVPAYNYRDRDQMKKYNHGVIEAIARYGLSSNGRSLVLFMSHYEMNNAFKSLEKLFINNDILPLIQSNSSLDIIETFKKMENSILFGVDRFWSGVDFPGRTLSQVIITKAPNPSISNPVIEFRKNREEDYMQSIYPSLAAHRLRQGFGRLMRKENDKGSIIILDRRYLFNYNSHLKNLPLNPEMINDQERIQKNSLSISGLKTEFKSRNINIDHVIKDEIESNKVISMNRTRFIMNNKNVVRKNKFSRI